VREVPHPLGVLRTIREFVLRGRKVMKEGRKEGRKEGK
jgi:hypothetical protein